MSSAKPIFDELKARVDERAAEVQAKAQIPLTPKQITERAERERVEQELAERRRQKEVESRIAEIVPTRFRGLSIERQEIAEWSAGILAGTEDRGLLVAGPTGTGKTGNVCATIEHIIRNGYRGIIEFHSFRILLRELRPDGNFDFSRLEQLLNRDLLCLDDVGSNKGSEWTEDQLGDIVDWRYQWALPTVVTVNVLPAQMGSVVGDRVASRLAETCVTVVMGGDDRRRKPQA